MHIRNHRGESVYRPRDYDTSFSDTVRTNEGTIAADSDLGGAAKCEVLGDCQIARGIRELEPFGFPASASWQFGLGPSAVSAPQTARLTDEQ